MQMFYTTASATKTIQQHNYSTNYAYITVGVIFRPYRRKSSVTIGYFPSVRMENSELLQLISMWTEIKCNKSLFSVRTNTDSADGATLLSKVLAQTN